MTSATNTDNLLGGCYFGGRLLSMTSATNTDNLLGGSLFWGVGHLFLGRNDPGGH